MHTSSRLAIPVLLILALGSAPAADPKPFPGTPTKWQGFARHDFKVDGMAAIVVVPEKALPGRPWVWRGEFFGAFADADIALVKAGWHLAYLTTPDLFGSPKAIAKWEKFYDVLVTDHGLHPRPGLIGLSRGGLYCMNWAAAHPDRTLAVYLDNAVCDFKSWPGGKPLGLGTGKGSEAEWAKVLAAHGFKDSAEAIAYKLNPVDNLAPLAKVKIPLLLVYGDADTVVPAKENSDVVYDRYKKLDAPVERVVKPGQDHHPHGLTDVKPVVEFFTRALAGKTAADKEPVRPASHWPQWRGPDRLNRSPDTGLLKSWPADGPPLIWQVTGIGQGVGPVAVANGIAYILGHRDQDEYLTAITEATGKPLWSIPLGPSQKEFDPMRWLSQRTPLIDDGRVYSVTAKGELTCVSADAGKVLWRKEYVKDFAGQRGGFGVCDQLLSDGDRLIGVPGGKTAAVVGLNKRTGEVAWTCPLGGPLGEQAAYVGAVLVDVKGVQKHYVAVTSQGLVGVSTEGKVLWRNTQFKNNTANSCTPNVIGNRIFCAENYSRGCVLLELTSQDAGVDAKQVYHQPLGTPSWHEMVICVGDHAYIGLNAGLICMELNTGKTLWKETFDGGKSRPPYTGTWADGRFYLRTLQGEIRLVTATPEGSTVDGKFQLPAYKPKASSTAPVVTGGRLFLRDEDQLYCYDVLAGSKPGKPTVHEAPPPMKSTLRPDGDPIYVPTPQDVVEKMLELAKVTKADTLVDLGCGDGRIVVTGAKQYGCRAIGYDIDAECVRLSQENVKKQDVGELVTIEKLNLFTVDLEKTTVVALYLPSKTSGRLLPQLEKLPAGARVVSHAFAVPGLVPDQEITVRAKEDGLDHKVFLYTVPLKKAK